MSKSYQYVLLDWDGNLAQTLNMWPDALDIVLRRQNIILSRRNLIEACGGVAAFLEEHTELTNEDGKKVLEDATEIVKEMLPNVELYPDAIAVLNELKTRGKKLALITSSIRSVVEPLLEKFHLNELFDTVVCIEDTVNRKPHPEPLELALRHINGIKGQAVMIGDTEKDIKAAANAELDSILFYPPEHKEFYDLSKLKENNPTYVIHDFKQVLEIAS